MRSLDTTALHPPSRLTTRTTWRD